MVRVENRAIIIGAGPGGLTAALALRKAGFETAIYERARERTDTGSGLTLWPNAIQALETLGLAEAVRSCSLPSCGIAMRSWRGTPLFFIDSHPNTDDPSAVYSVAIHRAALQKVLLDAVGENSVTFGARATGFRQTDRGVVAFFEDGSEVRGDLLVGADGIRSTIRTQLFGPKRLKYAGYTVWRGIARFVLKENVGLVSTGRGAQFGLFPLKEGQVYWFASVVAPEGDRDWSVGRKRELLERFSGWHEPITAVIEATDQDSILRNDIYDLDPMRAWSDGRVTVLGDAAHPTTPGLGQGACQAIEDAIVLAESLSVSQEIAPALKDYETRRIPRAKAITLQSRRMGQMGKWKNPLLCWLRDTMMMSIPEGLMLHQLRKVFSFEGRQITPPAPRSAIFTR